MSGSGSGLLTYFKHFFPNAHNIDYERSLNDLTEDEFRGEEYEPSVIVESTPQPMTLHEWRNMQKRSLRVYFQKRLLDPPGERQDTDDDFYYSSSDDEDDSEEEGDLEDVNAVNLLGTQEDVVVVVPKKRERKRKIPHVHEATFTVRNDVKLLDLQTQDFSLDYARVLRIWRNRPTKRWNHNKNYCQRVPIWTSNKRMPSFPFPGREEDGPMAAAFRNVVTLEVQVEDDHNDKRSSKCLRIFLYDGYADAFDAWTTQQIQTFPKLLLRLTNVPALCVFPFAIDPNSWFDQNDVMEYCLCIGDESTLTILRGHKGQTRKLRLDNEAMELRLAHIGDDDDDTVVDDSCCESELVMSQETLAERNCQFPSRMLRHQWSTKKKRRIERLQRQDEATAAATTTGKVTEGVSSTIGETSVVGENSKKRNQDQPSASEEEALKDASNVATQRRQASEISRQQEHGDRHHAATKENSMNGPSHSGEPPRPPMPMFQSPKRRRIGENKSDPFRYTTLSELEGIQSIAERNSIPFSQKTAVHVFASVLLFSSVTMTTRGDYTMTVNLMDETYNDHPISLIIFAKQADKLPRIRRVGDVLRMHRVVVARWQGNIQLQSKKESSYLVIGKDQAHDDNDDDSWFYSSTAKNNYTFTNQDEERSHALWAWTQGMLQTRPTMKEEHRTTLGDVSNIDLDNSDMARDRDFTVMITGIYPYPPHLRSNSTPHGFIRIWDGTGEAPNDPWPTGTDDFMLRTDPPFEAVMKVNTACQNLQKSDSRLTFETHKSLCGRVANGLIWEAPHWEMVTQNLSVGCFVRMRNVRVQKWAISPTNKLKAVHPKTWLAPLPDQTYEVKELLVKHAKRVQRHEYNPESGLLPKQLGSGLRSESLGNGLLEFAGKTSVSRYQGFVNILATNPAFNGSLAPYCQAIPNNGGFRYKLSVTIVDRSTAASVLVSEAAAEKLVGMKAEQAVLQTKATRFIDPDDLWDVTLQSIKAGGGEKYLVLVLADIHEAISI